MKLHRSALMAGLLALGVGACGDDVQVVEPTPPPPPPLVATMAPQARRSRWGTTLFSRSTRPVGLLGRRRAGPAPPRTLELPQ